MTTAQPRERGKGFWGTRHRSRKKIGWWGDDPKGMVLKKKGSEKRTIMEKKRETT